MSSVTGTYTYIPRGVCSAKMEIDLQGGIITGLRVENGCSGNLQGIIRLVEGCAATEVIGRLRGIHCGRKQTSCPDQLSLALAQALEKLSEGGLNDA